MRNWAAHVQFSHGTTATIQSTMMKPPFRPVRTWLDRLAAPRSTGEDSRRQEHILNVLLIGTLGLALLSVLSIFVRAALSGSGFVAYAARFLPGSLIAFCFFLALYLLSRYRFYRLSAFLLIGLYFLIGCYMVAEWGIVIPQGIFVYVLVIIMSSVLVSTRFGQLAALLTAAYYVLFASLESHGLAHPDISWRLIPEKTVDSFFYSANFLLISTVSWLSNREIDRSLGRARRSEAELMRERDLLEVKVEERTRELEQLQMEKLSELYRFAELGKVTSGIMHDLATPLTTLTANLSQVPRDDQDRLMKRVREGTRQIERYIDEARRQIRNQKESSLFPVNRQVQQAVRSLEERSRSAGVQVRVAKEAELYLFGSPFRFRQLVINVLSNAIESYHGMRHRDAIRVEIARGAGGIGITVSDAGKGMAPDVMERVFDPLFSTKGADGTGLGLSLCKEIVEKDFAGTITVESKPGSGSTFTITIPENGAGEA